MPEALLNPSLEHFAVIVLSALVILRLSLHRKNFYALTISIVISASLAEGLCRLLTLELPEQRPTWEEDRNLSEVEKYALPNSELRYVYPDNPRGYFDGQNQVSADVSMALGSEDGTLMSKTRIPG